MPFLPDMYKWCLDNRVTPDPWKKAKMVLIPKEGKDPAHSEVYRLISLLNTDYKILAIILTDCLNRIVGNYISKDQKGFIKY